MTTPPTVRLRKTSTAAEYVHTHTTSADTRARAAVVLGVLADVHSADDPATATMLRDLLVAVADCAGSDWLAANADDPDVRRLMAYLETPVLIPGDAAELDELLATVLWARHGPQAATA